MVKMKVDSKILQEIKRFNSINKYIVEQATDEPLDLGAPPTDDVGLDLPEPGGLGAAPTGDTSTVTPPPPPGGDMGATGTTTGTTVDIANDPDVEEIGGEEETETEGGDTEELDITDLVDTQKSMSDKQEEYFNNLFSQLQNLESKLGEMDNLVNKINDLETKFDRFRPKTPVEKLELRSLDSGPFNQKLSDFFEDKQEDMQKSGKNEYVLTTDQIEELSPREVKDTFNDFGDYDDENDMM